MTHTTSQECVLLWFRQDLRLDDNPALIAAAQTNLPIVPLFIIDDDNAGAWKMGGASRVWLYHSLAALNKQMNGHMCVFNGRADDLIPRLMTDWNARAVFWNRCYEPWQIGRDKRIKDSVHANGLHAESFNASLLYEPWTVKNLSGEPYRVFTPFYRKGCKAVGDPPPPREAPSDIRWNKPASAKGHDHTWDPSGLLPRIRWDQDVITPWQPGTTGANARFAAFVQTGLRGYKDDRNRPDRDNVSRLSPYLHWGEISVRRIWHDIARLMHADPSLERDADHFLSELGWREFSHHLLFHFPHLPEKPFQPKFERFPWDHNPAALTAWQKGQTGYPIIDAGMRELYATGWMHNRVRMIVASFLIKDLLIHWREGENWFWDTLFDADLANNAASWQWVAGSGADAAPYFRIFNPVLQGEKFDPQGVYVRRWVPEIAHLPDTLLHTPWLAPNPPAAYPPPLVDHAFAKTRALEALKTCA